jgi:RimJ/RimL family protein N-acetyltransferase
MRNDEEAPSPETTLRFDGELVRLDAFDVEADAQDFGRWIGDPSSARLTSLRPVLPLSFAAARTKLEEWLNDPRSLTFAVRTLADGRLVGTSLLKDIDQTDQTAELGIAIFRPEDRGKGFGREAIVLTLRYAFDELGLHRVGLYVSSFNERAIALYEKLGFQHEGRTRESIRADGRRYDTVLMGLLHDEFSS